MKPEILIVDDDPAFRSLLQCFLEARKFQVFTVSAPSLSWKYLQNGSIRLLIVDGVLPEMMGMELVAEVRSEGHHFPIFYVSAHLEDPQIMANKARAWQIQKVYAKPLDLDQLVADIIETLGLDPSNYQAPKCNSPQKPEDNLEALMAKLKKKYRQTLPEQLQELRHLVDGLQRTPNRRSHFLEDAYRLAHKIHGTSGTFGFEIASQCGAMIEETLGAWLDEGKTPLPVQWKKLYASLEKAFHTLA